jgi:FHS family L-fucose permease-like MFS transporter
LFIIASGLTFLETAANPYVTVLGDEHTATQRLNLSQSFNGLAASLAPLAGKFFILTDTTISEEQLKTLSSSEVDALLTHEAQSVQIPYIVIGLVVLSVAAILWKTNLPEIKESTDENSATEKGSIFKQTNLMLGVLAQFFYVEHRFVYRVSLFVSWVKRQESAKKRLLAIWLLLCCASC